MFPITPVELHEGWIVGRERTVTCVSGTYTWANKDKPNVLAFDITGLPVTPDATVTQIDGGWRVELHLKDWAQIAVIESEGR